MPLVMDDLVELNHRTSDAERDCKGNPRRVNCGWDELAGEAALTVRCYSAGWPEGKPRRL